MESRRIKLTQPRRESRWRAKASLNRGGIKLGHMLSCSFHTLRFVRELENSIGILGDDQLICGSTSVDIEAAGAKPEFWSGVRPIRVADITV